MASAPTTSFVKGAFCTACGAQLNEGARFCHRCGTPVVTGAAMDAGARAGNLAAALPWGVAALALVALISLLAGQFIGRRSAASTEAAAAPPVTRAPDISAMSPQERADRLFDRVMTYASSGKIDSAQFFAPMAIASFEALTPRTNHVRYDLGMIALVTTDIPTATAQADTILRSAPTHLLGLILAARAAVARGDTATQHTMEKRFLAAEPGESAKALPEYADHANEIRAALAAMRGQGRE